MTDPSPRSFGSDFKQFFLRGLVVLLPTVLTLWIVVKAYQFIDSTIAEPINQGIRLSIHRATPHWALLREKFEPREEEIQNERARIAQSARSVPSDEVIRSDLRRENIQEWWDSWWLGVMDLIGIAVAITGVYFAGRFLGGYIGRQIYRRVEGAIISVPVFKQVYPYVKQVVDFLLGEDRQMEFKRVVLVEYPRRGVWSIGLLTGSTMKGIAVAAGDAVTVFIPSSPTPFTGYTITVPRKDVIEVPITIDEALRFTVSGGVLIPPHQTLPPSMEGKSIQQPAETGLHPLQPPPAGDVAREEE